MAAVLQILLDILGNLRRELYCRCASCRCAIPVRIELSRCLSARLLLGAFSRCLSARLLLGAFSRLFGACGFRQRGKPLPRLRLCWPCETGINLGRKTLGFFGICFGVCHFSFLLVSQASTRVGRDEVWQNQNSLVEIFHRAADIAGLAQGIAAKR